VQIPGEGARSTTSSRDGASAHGAPQQKKPRRKKNQNSDADDMMNLTVSQPMVDKLLPARGVTFKNGKKVIRGDPIVEDPTETLRSRRQKDTHGFGHNSSLQPLDSILRQPKKSTRSVKQIIDQLESYKEPGADVAEDAASTASGFGQASRRSQEEEEEFEPVPPQQPAKLPPKKLRKVRATPGHLSYTTRQRKNVPTKERQRLAAPLFPATKGHGMMHSYLGQENPYANLYQSYLQSMNPAEEDVDGTIRSHIDEDDEEG